MKVLLVNGSPKKGNTYRALEEVARTLNEQLIETEIINLGAKAVQGCIGCGRCKELGHCVFQDDLMVLAQEKVKECDGLIVGTPVYYAGPNGSLCALLDRLFYSAGKYLRYKPAACVAVCRRGGASAAFDRLNKYFTINNMPVVSSQYWNSVHGKVPGDAEYDAEGLQCMRTLGRNMAWVLKNLPIQEAPAPEQFEEHIQTNFVR